LTKFIKGPVTWKLEKIMKQILPGYTSGCSWEDKEAMLNQYYQEGYRFVVFGDGSGWDKTQSWELKYVDRLIYNYLIDGGHIHHVDPEAFKIRVNTRHKKYKAFAYIDGCKTLVAQVLIDAKVGSGDTDTTLMNTVRMCFVQHFLMQQSGLEYKLWCSGDDFTVFTKTPCDLSALYYKYWAKKNTHLNEAYGLGLCLKFLKTSAIENCDFCSTNVIFEAGKFKMVRLPNRMYPLMHWSVKALAMNKFQLVNYMIDQAQGLEHWCHQMPFYKTYVDAIYHHYGKVKYKLNTKVGKRRIHLSDGPQLTQEEVQKIELGYEYYYKTRLRKSPAKVSDDAVYTYLYKVGGITKLDIANLEETLKRGGVIDLPDQPIEMHGETDVCI